VEVEPPLRQFGYFRDAAGYGYARHRVGAQIFQHATGKIAHVNQRDVRKGVQRLDRCFGRAASSAGDMRDAARAGHVDALLDASDPGGAGTRPDWPH
jgi:hypothetical protein